MAALLHVYATTDVLRAAIARATAQREAGRPRVTEQLALVGAEIVRVEQTMQRYHQAFEAGTMAPEDCGSRLQELGAQVRELRCREEELELASTQSSSIRVDDSHLTDVHSGLREAIEGGTPQEKKALLKALIAEIKVDGNEAAPL